MNKQLEQFRLYIKDKKVAVLGIGVSNTPLIKYLRNWDVDITAFDKADIKALGDNYTVLSGLGVKFCLGRNYLDGLCGFDVIFRTPGMRPDLPELEKARENGAVVTSEMEIFMDICPAEVFAVTGSDGKTTTTTLIYEILKEEGYRCWLGGNIGTPLLDRVEEMEESHKVVLELSSFQLMTIKKSSRVAVITNLSPNHLDVHKSMEEYVDAKKNIYRYQKESDKVILNYDNAITKDMALEARGGLRFFSRAGEIENGALLKDGEIVYKDGGKMVSIVRAEDIVIPGVHNIENYLAATAAVIDCVKPETVRKIAVTFKGVAHRIEFVRELNGVRFYNDSIASSPSRTIAGLKSFKQKVILIAGGKDKNIPYDPLGEVMVDTVKSLVLIGQTAPKIEKALTDAVDSTGKGKDIKVFKAETYEEAVKTAHSISVDGDVVILSPASTSFDMFKNFEERGNKFKEIVNKL